MAQFFRVLCETSQVRGFVRPGTFINTLYFFFSTVHKFSEKVNDLWSWAEKGNKIAPASIITENTEVINETIDLVLQEPKPSHRALKKFVKNIFVSITGK